MQNAKVSTIFFSFSVSNDTLHAYLLANGVLYHSIVATVNASPRYVALQCRRRYGINLMPMAGNIALWLNIKSPQVTDYSPSFYINNWTSSEPIREDVTYVGPSLIGLDLAQPLMQNVPKSNWGYFTLKQNMMHIPITFIRDALYTQDAYLSILCRMNIITAAMASMPVT